MRFISFNVRFSVLDGDNPYDALTQVKYLDSLSNYIDGCDERPINLTDSELYITESPYGVG